MTCSKEGGWSLRSEVTLAVLCGIAFGLCGGVAFLLMWFHLPSTVSGLQHTLIRRLCISDAMSTSLVITQCLNALLNRL